MSDDGRVRTHLAYSRRGQSKSRLGTATAAGVNLSPARITQEAVEVLESGAPVARLTQEAVEVLESGAPVARITQEAVEVLESGAPDARLTQIAVEMLVSVRPFTPQIWRMQ